jgi:3-methyladenine DNA glycosylase AlkD
MPTKSNTKPRIGSTEDQLAFALDWLKRHSTKKTRDGMARYGLPSDNALGVSVGDIRALAKLLGKNHDLAAALWDTGVYEARMLTSFVDDPALVTSAQMDRWCRDFDSWGICDTLCFHLFDRTAFAHEKIRRWSTAKNEFVKRAAFALIASVTVHDKAAPDSEFLNYLTMIEQAATDNRNFVKKAVNWALRCIGKKNRILNAAALETSKRLAASDEPSCRWVGKDALRELSSAAVESRLNRPRKIKEKPKVQAAGRNTPKGGKGERARGKP